MTQQVRTAYRKQPKWAWAAALALAAIVAGVLVSAAAPAPSTKIYSITPVAGTTSAPSGSATWALANNQASNQTIGSAEIRLKSSPSGFSITGATLNGNAIPSGSASTSTSKFDQTGLHLRNLNIAPNTSASVTVSFSAPCAGGTATWETEVRQSNDFLGTNNNFLNGNNKRTSLTTTIGPCDYKLVFVNQPTDVALATNSTTTSKAITDSSGNPVRVKTVYENCTGSCDAPISGATVTVS